MARSASSSAATGAADEAVTLKPAGARTMESPWLIHTSCSTGRLAKSSEESITLSGVRPYSPPRPADFAAELGGDELAAVADAEDRHARGVDRRVDGRRALDVDRGRAAGEDDPLRLAGQHLRHRHVAGDDLGVDVGLPHPAGDQLGVLRAEVDDEDRVDLVGLEPERHG